MDLASVPEAEWEAIASLGFDAVWLMGVWERSPAGIDDRGLRTRRSSRLPPCPARLHVRGRGRLPVLHPRLRGGRAPRWADRSAAARAALARRGLGLILDFVPNHVAPDHPWADAHPEYFVRGSDDELERDPGSFVRVRDGVWRTGATPTFPPGRT